MNQLNKIKIINFGPQLDEKGGVVTVINGIIRLKLGDEFVVETIPSTKEKFKVITFLKCIWKTIIKFIKEDISIVHVHMASGGSFYRKSIITIISKLFNIPVIIHVHGACFKEFYGGMNYFVRKYCNYIFNKCDKVIVLTEKWEGFFKNIIEKDKIHIVSNFVFLPEEIKRIEKTEDEKKIILFLGRLGQRKGTYDLIEAIDKLRVSNSNFKLILAGDGEIDKCREIVKQKSLEQNIDIVGWINDEEKQKYLENSDILVLPSYFESFGLSLIEAMSYKIPVIASWGGEMSEVVRDGIDGMLINPGNIDELTNKLKDLLCSSILRQQMGNNGYIRVVEKFSSEVAIRNIKKIYFDLL